MLDDVVGRVEVDTAIAPGVRLDLLVPVFVLVVVIIIIIIAVAPGLLDEHDLSTDGLLYRGVDVARVQRQVRLGSRRHRHRRGGCQEGRASTDDVIAPDIAVAVIDVVVVIVVLVVAYESMRRGTSGRLGLAHEILGGDGGHERAAERVLAVGERLTKGGGGGSRSGSRARGGGGRQGRRGGQRVMRLAAVRRREGVRQRGREGRDGGGAGAGIVRR